MDPTCGPQKLGVVDLEVKHPIGIDEDALKALDDMLGDIRATGMHNSTTVWLEHGKPRRLP